MMIVHRIRRALAGVGGYRPRPGDGVLDRYDRIEKTILSVEGNRLRVAFARGAETRTGALIKWPIIFVR